MRFLAAILATLFLGSIACRKSASPTPPVAEPWAVTAWGSAYEIFAEIEPLTAGVLARSNTHVTWLKDFSPLVDGDVAVVLSEDGRPPLVFEQKRPKRAGIYVVDVTVPRAGTYAMAFRIQGPGGPEEIPAGRVRVGGADAPGELLGQDAHGDSAAQVIAFLKEQQWRTEFSTDWVRDGWLRESVSGPARVRAAAGGEILLTAPVDAVVAPRPWPYVGAELEVGTAVFGLVPSVAAARSLPDLQAEAAALEAEEKTARGRTERLQQLLTVEAVSLAEVERASAHLVGVAARLEAARQDLRTATSAREGGRSAPTLFLRAPWPGQVAAVSASPGQSVAAGAVLGRILQARPVWIEVFLRPEDAARLSGEKASGLLLRRSERGEPLSLSGKDVRLVSVSPEVDARTSSIEVLLEVDRSVSELPAGTAGEAELLLAGQRDGVLVPVSALVDDGGVTVVYEQLEGESFARREVRVRQRQGAEAIVDGLRAGARVATRGGTAIRRASLLSSGAPEGHVH